MLAVQGDQEALGPLFEAGLGRLQPGKEVQQVPAVGVQVPLLFYQLLLAIHLQAKLRDAKWDALLSWRGWALTAIHCQGLRHCLPVFGRGGPHQLALQIGGKLAALFAEFFDAHPRPLLSRQVEQRRLTAQGKAQGFNLILLKSWQRARHGLDGDPKVLEIARLKAAKAGVNLMLDYGMAYQLPYPDGSFDRILSSLVFHHLTRDDKQRAMSEVYRVLRPGGEFHIVDFGKPRGVYGRLASQFIKRMEEAGDNVDGLLPVMMVNTGFQQVEEPPHYTTVFGTLTLYRGRKPDR